MYWCLLSSPIGIMFALPSPPSDVRCCACVVLCCVLWYQWWALMSSPWGAGLLWLLTPQLSTHTVWCTVCAPAVCIVVCTFVMMVPMINGCTCSGHTGLAVDIFGNAGESLTVLPLAMRWVLFTGSAPLSQRLYNNASSEQFFRRWSSIWRVCSAGETNIIGP